MSNTRSDYTNVFAKNSSLVHQNSRRNSSNYFALISGSERRVPVLHFHLKMYHSAGLHRVSHGGVSLSQELRDRQRFQITSYSSSRLLRV